MPHSWLVLLSLVFHLTYKCFGLDLKSKYTLACCTSNIQYKSACIYAAESDAPQLRTAYPYSHGLPMQHVKSSFSKLEIRVRDHVTILQEADILTRGKTDKIVLHCCVNDCMFNQKKKILQDREGKNVKLLQAHFGHHVARTHRPVQHILITSIFCYFKYICNDYLEIGTSPLPRVNKNLKYTNNNKLLETHSAENRDGGEWTKHVIYLCQIFFSLFLDS